MTIAVSLLAVSISPDTREVTGMLTSLTAVAIIILAVEAMLCLMIPLVLTIGIAYLLFRTRQFCRPN